MDNPPDLGFTIVEGTYNGLVKRSYNDRVHFTGALNPAVGGAERREHLCQSPGGSPVALACRFAIGSPPR